jgi:hypothetical protein
MSPTKKALPASLGAAKKKLEAVGRKVKPHQNQLASLIVGGAALVTAGVALFLVVRGRS